MVMMMTTDGAELDGDERRGLPSLLDWFNHAVADTSNFKFLDWSRPLV